MLLQATSCVALHRKVKVYHVKNQIQKIWFNNIFYCLSLEGSNELQRKEVWSPSYCGLHSLKSRQSFKSPVHEGERAVLAGHIQLIQNKRSCLMKWETVLVCYTTLEHGSLLRYS